MTGFATLQADGVTVIAAEGRLDALVSPDLDDILQQSVDRGQVYLVVDLGGVSYISSSCLRVLLLGARRARERGGDLKLCCLSPRVQQVFALAGFDLVFELWPSRAQAQAAFASTPKGPVQPCASG